ncbi:hypothetical protein scyTo_0024990, partial [Scyliorhinus torazame]|nr:hypothetical protein [Scyliorhinus torazame]
WRHRHVLGQAELDLETCLQAQQVKVVWCQGVLYRASLSSTDRLRLRNTRHVAQKEPSIAST